MFQVTLCLTKRVHEFWEPFIFQFFLEKHTYSQPKGSHPFPHLLQTPSHLPSGQLPNMQASPFFSFKCFLTARTLAWEIYRSY